MEFFSQARSTDRNSGIFRLIPALTQKFLFYFLVKINFKLWTLENMGLICVHTRMRIHSNSTDSYPASQMQ